jgi:hypothetical protein
MAERYAVGAAAFIAAAAWLGVGLTNGLICLFVFVVAMRAVRLYQMRSSSRARSGAGSDPRRRRESPPRHERETSPPPAPTRSQARRSGRLYDGAREDLGWPVPSEARW